MVNIETVKIFIMEEQYPFFNQSQLEAICQSTDNLNEAVYTACKMKARADKIKVGPIEIENDANYWNTLADSFYEKWQAELNGGSTTKSITGLCIGRADEF